MNVCVLALVLSFPIPSVAVQVRKTEDTMFTSYTKRLILVSGIEGSGTSMTARILCHPEKSMGIQTHFNYGQLAPSRQAKYENEGVAEHTDAIKNITGMLWRDDNVRSYLLSNIDTRSDRETAAQLDEVGARAQKLLDATGQRDLNTLVIHRSMPFGDCSKTPFLEDLPRWAEKIGPDWSAHAVIVIREPPKAWISHSTCSLNEPQPFLKQVEQLLKNDRAAPGLKVTFLSYETLVCDPQSALTQLSNNLGIDVAEMRGSPEFDEVADTLASHGGDKKYSESYDTYQKRWNDMSSDYPTLRDFVINGNRSC